MGLRSHLLATLALLAPLATWAQSESEPNDTPAEADPLTYGVSMSGSIGACGPTDNSVDYFALTLTGQGVLRVQTNISSSLAEPPNVTFSVYSSTGSFLSNFVLPAGAGGSFAEGEFRYTCRGIGTYYIRVNNPSGGGCTNYSFTYDVFDPVFADDAEPNNTTGEATDTLAYDTWTEGRNNFHYDNSVDYYRLVLPTNGELHIDWEAEHAGDGPGTAALSLYTSTGSFLVTWNVGVGASSVPIDTTVGMLCRGGLNHYFLRVTTSTCGISYRLKYRVDAPVFDIDAEPNNTPSEALILPVGTWTEGQAGFHYDNTTDYYRLDLPTNGELKIDWEAEHAGAATGAVTLNLYTHSGSFLKAWTVQAGGETMVADTVVSLLCRGNTDHYFLNVVTSTCGVSYRLKYEVEAPVFANDVEPNNTTGEAIAVAAGTWAEGQVEFYYDNSNDYYRLDLPSNGVLLVDWEAEHAGEAAGSATLNLYNHNGSFLAASSVAVGAGSVAIATPVDFGCRGNGNHYYLMVTTSTCGVSYRLRYEVAAPAFAIDEEPNNSTAQAFLLPVDTWSEGHVNFPNSDNIDYYRLDLPHNGVLHVDWEAEHASNGNATAGLDLYNSSGSFLHGWDVAVGGASIVLDTTVSILCRGDNDHYYLRVTSGTCGTSYRLKYRVDAPLFANDAEPNDAMATAIETGVDTWTEGQIEFYYDGSVDYYRLDLPSNGVMRIDWSAEHAGITEATATLNLLNSSGSFLQAWTVAIGPEGVALDTTVHIDCRGDGDHYYLYVSTNNCGTSYRMRYRLDAPVYDISVVAGTGTGDAPTIDLDAGPVDGQVGFHYGPSTAYYRIVHPAGPLAIDPGAEHAGEAEEELTVNLYSASGSFLATTVLPVGGNSTPMAGTADFGERAAADYFIRISGAPCGTSFRIECFDDDADGVCNGSDLCDGPEPGLPCDDGDANTVDDTVTESCDCVGTPIITWDCPALEANIGDGCDDGDANTEDDTVTAECDCVGTPVITWDCPALEANIGDGCDDGDAGTEDDTVTAECDCVGTPVITWDCPALEANIGDNCDDGDANTINDLITADCNCVGTPVGDCTNELTIEITTDANGAEIAWSIEPLAGGSPLCGGAGLPSNAVVTADCCLPDGCYRLVVTDAGGDGIAGGGYVLRTADGERIIDNTGNFSTGSVSSLADGFCLPLGDDRPISTSCDRTWWQSGNYLVAAENPAVSAEFGVSNTTSGYEFWFYDPNGGFSFRKFRNHATSDGFAPNNAMRAAHIKLNNWAAANHLQDNVLYNVRIRGVVDGTELPYGPACRVVLDPVAAACTPTGLNDIAGHPNFSCGVSRTWGGPNSAANRLYARSVGGANKYQFEFSNADEAYLAVVQSNTVIRHLNWSSQPALNGGSTYQVRVRASKDGGTTWCNWGWACEVTIAPGVAPGGESFAALGQAGVSLWPNPNNGRQLWMEIDGLSDEVRTIAVDIHDLSGKRVIAREVRAQHGALILDLNGGLAAGTYVVAITAGDQRFVERLVITD